MYFSSHKFLFSCCFDQCNIDFHLYARGSTGSSPDLLISPRLASLKQRGCFGPVARASHLSPTHSASFRRRLARHRLYDAPIMDTMTFRLHGLHLQELNHGFFSHLRPPKFPWQGVTASEFHSRTWKLAREPLVQLGMRAQRLAISSKLSDCQLIMDVHRGVCLPSFCAWLRA